MMRSTKFKIPTKQNGYSILELLLAMALTLGLMGIVTTILSDSLGIKTRESRKTDALTSAQAALNVMSREIANSGFGLTTNGIVAADSNSTQLHFRSNIDNSNLATDSPGEDITYYSDLTTESIVRFDPNAANTTSAIIHKISDVSFVYFDYSGSNSIPVQSSTPSNNTGRIRIIITVQLEEVEGQPRNQVVTFSSDITLRNSNYMLNQY